MNRANENAVRHARWMRVAAFILAALAVLPVLYAPDLTWIRYGHSLLVAVALGYLLWRARLAGDVPVRGGGAVSFSTVLALVMVYVFNQFQPGVLGIPVGASTWVAGALVVMAGVAASLGREGGKRPGRRADGVAVAVAVLAATLVLLSTLLERGTASQAQGPGALPWTTLGQILLSLLLWFATTRVAAARPRTGWRLGLWVWGVFAVLALVGLTRAALSLYWVTSGERACAAGDFSTASRHYQQARRVAVRLGLDRIGDRAAFDLAGLLAVQGRDRQATSVLGLEHGYVQRIAADEWEGPEGGRLFYMVSCWKDVILYPGDVEVCIYARGDSALDVWPLMRVKLGGRTVQIFSVNSSYSRPYTFSLHSDDVHRARLEITFLNDLKQDHPPADRNLWVEEAEIRYRTIDWPVFEERELLEHVRCQGK